MKPAVQGSKSNETVQLKMVEDFACTLEGLNKLCNSFPGQQTCNFKFHTFYDFYNLKINKK